MESKAPAVETAISSVDEFRAAAAENEAQDAIAKGLRGFSVDPTIYVALRGEIRRLQAVCNSLVSCIYPAMLGIEENEEMGEPVPDDTVLLHFQSAKGAVDYTTAGQIRKAISAIKPQAAPITAKVDA